MATEYYNLPTINDSGSMIAFVDGVNALAVSADAVLEGVRESFESDPYELPIAGKQSAGGELGGVIVGSGFDVYADGTLELETENYKLPAATADEIGGVKVGSGLNVTEAGALSLDTSKLEFEAATTAKFADGAAHTEDFEDNSVTRECLANDVYNELIAVPSALKTPGGAWRFPLGNNSGGTSLICYKYGSAVYCWILHGTENNTTSWLDDGDISILPVKDSTTKISDVVKPSEKHIIVCAANVETDDWELSFYEFAFDIANNKLTTVNKIADSRKFGGMVGISSPVIFEAKE